MKIFQINSLICILFQIYLVNSSIIPTNSDFLIDQDGLVKLKRNGLNGINKNKSLSFDQFKSNYGKFYGEDKQNQNRKASFIKNMKKLEASQCSPCGVTPFMDKSDSQLANLFGTLSGYSSQLSTFSENHRLLQQTTLLKPIWPFFDWKNFGYVTSVKNQQDCGSCWAFAATAFYQSQLIRRKVASRTIDLAQQFILQCSVGGETGCAGGSPFLGLRQGLKFGIPLESSFPYSSQRYYNLSSICKNSSSNIYLPANSSNSVGNLVIQAHEYKISEDYLMSELLKRPVILYVAANQWIFYYPTSTDYQFSCSTPESINRGQINHAVLLVGYTETSWIIKNSWGTDWGVNGYIYISRDLNHNCGIGFGMVTLDFALPILFPQHPN